MVSGECSFKCNNMLHFHPNAFFSQFSFSDWQISENAIWHCSIYGQWKSFFHLFHQESLCLSQSSLHFLHIQSEQCPLLLELFMRFRQVPHGVLHFLEANRDWRYSHWTPFKVMPYSSSFGEAHSITFRRIRTFQMNILLAVDLVLWLIIQPLAQQSKMCVISSSYKSVLAKHLY